MLHKIRQFFSFRKASDDAPEIVEDSEQNLDYPVENPNFVSQRAKVIKLLQQLANAPHRCTATLEDADEIFTTTLLDVRENDGALILDTLNSSFGNNLLLTHKSAKLSTYLNKVPVTFTLDQVSAVQQDASVYFKAPLPSRVYYPQRRSSPRINVPTANLGFQGMLSDTGMTVGGYVSDLSRQGLAVYFNDERHTIHRGDRLEHCLIDLPGGQQISFDVSVRFLKRQNPGSPKKQIGGLFENMAVQSQNALERYICALEREQIRKQRNSAFALSGL